MAQAAVDKTAVSGRRARGLAGNAFLAVTGLFFVANLYLIFWYAPTEAVMGNVQRLFYFHVPSVWVGFLGFFIVFISSIMYLVKRTPIWDRRAYVAGEVGLVFLTVAILAGSIWAKPVWGVWWVWDAKLTTTFILWVIYVGYLMVRAYAPNSDRGARWAAVIGIIGFFDVPIVYYAAQLWNGLHPALVTGPDAQGSLAPAMLKTLLFSLVTFTLLFVYLFNQRSSQREIEEAIEELRGETGPSSPSRME